MESQDYEVKGEARDCDALDLRGKEAPVVVELKMHVNSVQLDHRCMIISAR